MRRYRGLGLPPEDLRQVGKATLVLAARLWRDDGGASLRNHMARMLRWELRKAGARERRWLEFAPSPFEEDLYGHGASQEDLLAAGEVAVVVCDAVSKLPHKQRVIVRLHMCGYDFRTIAKKVGVSKSRAQRLYRTGLDTLRVALLGAIDDFH